MIPGKPLEFNDFDPGELSWDELLLFTGERESGPQGMIEMMVKLRAFLLAHSNWTAAEIGAIKVKEMEAISGQILTAVEQAVIPKASSPS